MTGSLSCLYRGNPWGKGGGRGGRVCVQVCVRGKQVCVSVHNMDFPSRHTTSRRKASIQFALYCASGSVVQACVGSEVVSTLPTYTHLSLTLPKQPQQQCALLHWHSTIVRSKRTLSFHCSCLLGCRLDK